MPEVVPVNKIDNPCTHGTYYCLGEERQIFSDTIISVGKGDIRKDGEKWTMLTICGTEINETWCLRLWLGRGSQKKCPGKECKTNS